jgi:actin-related protein
VGVGPAEEGVGAAVLELLREAQGGKIDPEFFGLDAAVLHSIDRAYRPDMRSRLFGNILVVGGGARLPGLVEALESRVEQRVRGDVLVDAVNVKPPKAFPGAHGVSQSRSTAVWRGGCLLAALDLNRDESWLPRDEWVHGGGVPGRTGKLGARETLLAQLLWHVAN